MQRAKIFCLECQYYLCGECASSHERFSKTLNHALQDILDTNISSDHIEDHIEDKSYVNNTSPNFTRLNQEQGIASDNAKDISQIADTSGAMCPGNKQEAEIYYQNHNEISCSNCSFTKHRKCQASLINDTIASLNQDFDNGTFKEADDVKAKVAKIKIIYMNTCSTAFSTLSLDYDNHKRLRETGNKRQKFLTNLKLMHTLKDVEAAYEDIIMERQMPRISFSRNQTLSVVLRTDSFDTISHKVHNTSHSIRNDMAVHSPRKLNVKLYSDRFPPWISSSACLQTGDLILCDRVNKCLTILDHEFSVKRTLETSGQLRDCCCIDNNEVLVTLPVEKQVQWFHLVPSIQLKKKTIHLDKQCEGIATLNQDIYVTCHNEPEKEIRILDRHRNLQKTILLNETGHFKTPFYITVSDNGDIYVSETVSFAGSDYRSQI